MNNYQLFALCHYRRIRRLIVLLIFAAAAGTFTPESHSLAAKSPATQAAIVQRNANVILLIDASPSMVNNIEAVKEVATSVKSSTASNANVDVYRFSSDVKSSSIESINIVSDGATCLYDALATSINTLTDRQATRSVEQSAIVAFTDGRDEKNPRDGRPRNEWPQCSTSTIEKVIQQAQNAAPSIPIHTIGLCNQPCLNLDRVALQQLSSETSGISIISDQNNLNRAFQPVMERITTQQTDTVPRILTNFRYAGEEYDYQNKIGDYYEVTITLSGYMPIAQLILTVHTDSETGGQKGNPIIRQPTSTSLVFKLLPSDFGMEVGREHVITIKATDFSGNFFEKESGGFGDDGDTTLLGTIELGPYTPPEEEPPEPVEFVVGPYRDLDWSLNQMRITLADLSSAEQDRLDYFEVDISDTSTNESLFPEPYTQPFEEPHVIKSSNRASLLLKNLPDAMQRSEEIIFVVTLYPFEGQGEPSTSESEEAKIPPLGFFGRIQLWLQQNPQILWVGLGFLISSIIVWLLLTRKNSVETSQPLGMPPPIGGYTTIAQAEAKIRLKVIKSEKDKLEDSTKTLTEFPCILGRSEQMEHLEMATHGVNRYLNIGGDARISHYHLKIKMEQGEFFVEDLESSNKSYLEQRRLQPNESVPLPARASIRLGKQTHIELKIS